MVQVRINDYPISAQLDSGADISVLSRPDYAAIGSPAFTTKPFTATGFGKQTAKVDGSFEASITLGESTKQIQIYVADTLDLFISRVPFRSPE